MDVHDGKVTMAAGLRGRTYLSDPVKLVGGTPVILIAGFPGRYLLSLMQLMFEVQLGFVVKVL